MSSLTPILNFADPDHPIIRLANQLPWDDIQASLAKVYSPKKSTHKPIRLMVGLLLIRFFHDLDEEDTIENWMSNPYFQYLTGETTFQWDMPCEPTDLENFLHCIGSETAEELLKTSAILLELQNIEDELEFGDEEDEEFEEFGDDEHEEEELEDEKDQD
jgi:hypothetical protein